MIKSSEEERGPPRNFLSFAMMARDSSSSLPYSKVKEWYMLSFSNAASLLTKISPILAGLARAIRGCIALVLSKIGINSSISLSFSDRLLSDGLFDQTSLPQ
jgi:hypothetical protein